MQFVRNGIEVFLFFLCSSTIFLVGSWWVLQSHFNDLASSLSIKASTETERTAQIREINTLLADTQSLQETFIAWTPRIQTFVSAIPDGVTLSNLSLSAYKKTYLMSGFAVSRESLLVLKERLLARPEVKDVNIPLSQLIERENISFSLTIDVN